MVTAQDKYQTFCRECPDMAAKDMAAMEDLLREALTAIFSADVESAHQGGIAQPDYSNHPDDLVCRIANFIGDEIPK